MQSLTGSHYFRSYRYVQRLLLRRWLLWLNIHATILWHFFLNHLLLIFCYLILFGSSFLQRMDFPDAFELAHFGNDAYLRLQAWHWNQLRSWSCLSLIHVELLPRDFLHLSRL